MEADYLKEFGRPVSMTKLWRHKGDHVGALPTLPQASPRFNGLRLIFFGLEELLETVHTHFLLFAGVCSRAALRVMC